MGGEKRGEMSRELFGIQRMFNLNYATDTEELLSSVCKVNCSLCSSPCSKIYHSSVKSMNEKIILCSTFSLGAHFHGV